MDAFDFKLRTISSWVTRGLYLVGKCAASTKACRSQAVIVDSLMFRRTGLRQIMSGSRAEGTYISASDVDRMQILHDILVVNDPDEEVESHCQNTFFLNKTYSNPGYTRLQLSVGNSLAHDTFGDFKDIMEVTPEGVFLSSEKFVKYQYDHHELPAKAAKTLKRHGPCLSGEDENIYGFHNKNPEENLELDMAFSLLCNSWPDKEMEWFTRERKHYWPSENLINKIRKEDCHVVPVGDQTSKQPSLDWRLSFLLGERELIWNFNDTQIQCYIILKLLIKIYVYEKEEMKEQVSSYHMKTTVFWVSENLGISAWREDQLLHCVNRCLTYFSNCVKERRLDHYFYRKNNLLRHKLEKSEDRQFVLDKIQSIQNNLIVSVLDCLPESYLVRQLWSSCQRKVEHFEKACSKAPTLSKYYEVCKNVSDTHKRYQAVFNLFCNFTDYLDSEDFIQSARKEFHEEPPADADALYIEKMIAVMDIRSAIKVFRSSLDTKTGGEEWNDLPSQSLLKMEDGASLDDLVGNLYLATLHYCLGRFTPCENLTLEGVRKRQYLLYTGRCSSLIGLEVSLHDLKVIQTKDAPVTGEVDEVIDTVYDVVFSREDTDFVPYPLKLECAIFPEEGERYFIVHPFVYAFTLLFMTETFLKNSSLARKYLDNLAETVHQVWDSAFLYRAYNILGCCYAIDGQLNKAISCYIKSIKITRDKLVGKRTLNAALYHLAILCFSVYMKDK